MANKKEILDKVSRNLGQLGFSVSFDNESVVVDNGSNDLTISYVYAEIQKPMGGIDDEASPFLGIGVANPGKIKMKSAINTAGTIADVMDSVIAAQVLVVLSGFANDLVLENSDASFSEDLRGHVDLLGMGM